METGESLSTDPRQGPVRQRLSRGRPLVEALNRVPNHRRRPPDRHGLDARSADARVRLEVRRLGPCLCGNDRGPHHRMRCSVDRRQLPVRLAEHPRHGEHRLPDRRSLARRQLHRHQTRRHRRPRQYSVDQRAAPLRDGRPACLHHARRASPISRPSSSKTPAGTTVRVHGISGHPNTDFYKVSIAYSDGYKAVGTLVYSWPDALRKSPGRRQDLRPRLERLGLKFDTILTEFVGVNATHGQLAGEPDRQTFPKSNYDRRPRPRQSAVERFTKEIAPLILTGPPASQASPAAAPKSKK